MSKASRLRNQTSALLFINPSTYRIASHRITLTEIPNRILSQCCPTEWQEERTVGRCIVKEEEPELNGYNSRQGLDWRGTTGNAIPSCLSFPPFLCCLPFFSASIISTLLFFYILFSKILLSSLPFTPSNLSLNHSFTSHSYLLLSSLTSISDLGNCSEEIPCRRCQQMDLYHALR